MLLPSFPDFLPIKNANGDTIKHFWSELPPYSESVFSNLWSWNIDGSFKISTLNGNLILLIRDTQTSIFSLSLCGTHLVNETLEKMFECIEDLSVSPIVTLVPEETASLIDISKFNVQEDRDNFDYVYSTEELSKLEGREFKAKRHLVNQFLNTHENYRVDHVTLTPKTKLLILQFTSSENRKRSALGHVPFAEYEMAAMEHFFLLQETAKMIASLLYVDKNLVGYTIDEKVNPEMALSHFFKVSTEYKGAYDILNTAAAKHLYESGILHWNWVEDLGMPGLRKAKLSYRPEYFLKKFTVSKLT